MKKILLPFLLLCSIAAFAQQEHYLLIGTYTGGKSEGIYVYKFNSATGDNSFVSVVKSSNPSFLAVSPNQKFVYAVNENADSTRFTVGGNISAFAFNKKEGTLTEINKQPSGGKHPCYVAIDKTGQWVFAGNYTSGSIGLLHANKDGSLDTLQQIIQHNGSGPNTDRQKGPHVHSTNLSADNKYLYVPDLGIDKVMIYTFDKTKGILKYKTQAPSTPGNGPRHMSFSADNKFAYLMEEMSGTVVCYKVNNGSLQLQQRISALPADFKGAIGSADIHVSPDGRFLYCSNRGDANTISIFSIDKTTGKLTLKGDQSTMGKTPRNFNFDPSGNFLLVANQNTDDIFIFKVDKKTGMLTDTGKKITVGSPVCLKWIQ
ncbi:lactonase family protein [Ferruginibacter profundus]